MTTFSTTNKAPGVYIQEVQLPGPIAGVGTSTAAFVGAARGGPLGIPTRVQTWTDFVATFGVGGDAYFTQLPIYVTHAVAGFFANGGSDLWFVRVGSGHPASLALKDRSAGGGRDTLVVTATAEGSGGNGITVEVKDAGIAATTALRAASTLAAASGANATQVQLQPGAAAAFAVGDVVAVDDGTNQDQAGIASITGDTLDLAVPLTHAFAANTPVRVADLASGQKAFRVADATGFEPGSDVSVTDGTNTEAGVVQSVVRSAVPGATDGTVTLSTGLANAYQMDAADPAVDVTTLEFGLVVAGGPGPPQTLDKLSMDPRHSRYFAAVIASTTPPLPVTVAAADPPNVTAPPGNLPAVLAATALQPGVDDDPSSLGANDYTTGIDALRRIDEVNMLCVPDRPEKAVQTHMIAHCEELADRFAILDPIPGADITAQRGELGSDGGYAALYYPRVVISDPTAPGTVTIPPSGHLAGLYARVDDEVGVFKAPANERLRDVLDVERRLGAEQQGPLNEEGINVIRVFPNRGPVVWGARTISTSTQWRYVNVRRFLLFVEESLQEGTAFVVFEPNTPALWQQVKRQVSEFLTRQWVAGALVGTSPDEAFSVRVDQELNPPAVVALGQLVIEVTLYPAPPAEFVVFRIIQQPGGPVVLEA